MSHYTTFRRDRTDYPARPYEACVFLSNAILHLANSERKFGDDAITVLIEAHSNINDDNWKAA